MKSIIVTIEEIYLKPQRNERKHMDDERNFWFNGKKKALIDKAKVPASKAENAYEEIELLPEKHNHHNIHKRNIWNV